MCVFLCELVKCRLQKALLLMKQYNCTEHQCHWSFSEFMKLFSSLFKTDEGTSIMVKLGGIVICLHQRLTQRKQSCHWRKLVGCWLCWLWSHWLDTEEESSQRLVQLTMRLHLYRTWENKLTFSCYLVKVVFLAHVCGVVSLTKL